MTPEVTSPRPPRPSVLDTREHVGTLVCALSRRSIIPSILLLLVPFLVVAQEAKLVPADKFFSDLSAGYGKVQDYETMVTITQGKSVSHGRLSYKAPGFLRIDFDSPARQFINFDGQKLSAYMPAEKVFLQQDYKKDAPGGVAGGVVTAQGLLMWQRTYSIGYLAGASPVPLETGSKEMVVKLKLIARGAAGFTQMIVSVKGPLVRRIEATQASGDTITMDFANIRLNQGVPASRFVATAPADATVTHDWLFNPDE